MRYLYSAARAMLGRSGIPAAGTITLGRHRERSTMRSYTIPSIQAP